MKNNDKKNLNKTLSENIVTKVENTMLSNSNVIWHKGQITFEDRCKLLGQTGVVLWLTGLSGSGKSTIAVELEKEFTKIGKLCYRLDGDNLRHGLNSDLGFSTEEREENIRRLAEVAALFKDAGIITIVAFIAPFKKMRDFARNTVGEGFYEIYINTSLEECKKRDPKGLYKKAINGEITDFTGVSAPYEIPENPDLIIDTEKLSIKDAINLIFDKITI